MTTPSVLVFRPVRQLSAHLLKNPDFFTIRPFFVKNDKKLDVFLRKYHVF